VQSDDESEDDDYTGTKRNENAPSDDSGEEDDDRHARMLQAITGMPSEAFEGKKTAVKLLCYPLFLLELRLISMHAANFLLYRLEIIISY